MVHFEVIGDTGESRLDLLAQRNTLLPARSKKTYTVNRTVLRGTSEEVIHLIVKEGNADDLPESAKTVGYLALTGKQLSRDLPKGTDIEVTLEISESRELIFTVYVEACDQEFRGVGAETLRDVPTQTLAYESRCLLEKVEDEMAQAVKEENYEGAKLLEQIKRRVADLEKGASRLSPTDSTDDRYKLEDEKRRCAAEVGRLTKGKRFDTERRGFEEEKGRCSALVEEYGNDRERRYFSELLGRESYVIESGNARRLEELAGEMEILGFTILRRVPEFLKVRFEHFAGQQAKMNNQPQARSLIESGRAALAQQQWERLEDISNALCNLLPSGDQAEVAHQGFTGIVK